MKSEDVLSRYLRAKSRDEGVSRMARVVGVNLSGGGDPTVDVQPVNPERVYEVDGELIAEPALVYKEIRYAFPRSPKSAFWMPPETGMIGFFVMTDYEVGETGAHETDRIKDRGSGWFTPAGDPSGSFEGSMEWTELRGTNTRIATNGDEVHLQAGNANICIKNGAFDIVVGGVSLLGAMKQMSAHIKILETIHGQIKPRTIDTMVAATCPTRDESGV